MKVGLKQKIVWLTISATVIPITVMILITVLQKDSVLNRTDEELDTLMRDNIKQIAQDAYALCKTSNDILQQKVGFDLRVAHRVLQHTGKINLAKDPVKWKAINQYTKDQKQLELPRIMVGENWLGQNKWFHSRTPVVDEVYDLVGGTCTIFQRMNEQGDMLRVATTVQKMDNTRAIGTYIPAINPDGLPNPVIAKVLRGEDFYGRAYVVNAWYLTAYSPIKNEQGTIIGILYVGVKQEAVQSLREAIMDTVVGKTGYVHVLGATKITGVEKGDRGQYIISKNGERDGENIWNSQTIDGKLIIQKTINNALQLREGEVGYIDYKWKNPDDDTPRKKVVAYTYFRPWDWVICAGTYEDDYAIFKKRVSDILGDMLRWTLISGLVLMCIVLAAGLLLGAKIANPIIHMSEIAKKIAKGEMNQRIEATTNDEVGELAKNLKEMQSSLKNHIQNLDKLVANRTTDLQKAMKIAEHASQAKSDFIANMSHELRTPLNGIIGFAELTLATDSNEKHREYSDHIIAESEALLTLINEILDHAKIEAGKLTLDNVPFDIEQMLEQVISGMALRAHKKGLTFKLKLDDDIPRKLVGDPNRLRQVLVNLIGNALKFTEEGSVHLNVSLQENLPIGPKLHFAVQDTGIGISVDDQKTIFDSFSQADNSSSRQFGGTGLGTTIAKKLVELMQGEIGLTSQPGVGSTFWFTTQLRNCPEDLQATISQNISHNLDTQTFTGEGHILIVEDYPTNQEIAKNHLQSAGYTFNLACNGQEALDLTSKEQFDLILMDVQMPKMDGHEATRRIRAEGGENATIPIFATTANAYQEDKDKCLASGMDEVITKPLRKEILLKTINKWVKKKSSTAALDSHSSLQLKNEGKSLEPELPILNFDEFLLELSIDRQTASQIVQIFINDTEKQLPQISKLLATQEFETAEREIHSIKGGASSIRANALHRKVQQLENLIHKKEFSDIENGFQILCHEFEKLKKQFAKHS